MGSRISISASRRQQAPRPFAGSIQTRSPGECPGLVFFGGGENKRAQPKGRARISGMSPEGRDCMRKEFRDVLKYKRMS